MSEFVSGVDPASFPEPFAGLYRSHLQHLQLKGLRPKTVEAYARAMRRIGEHFDFEVTALSPAQLTDYFTAMKASHSWSGVKLDLYGLKFFTEHVLGQPWAMPGFIRPPKTSRLPDIVSIAQVQAILDRTRRTDAPRGRLCRPRPPKGDRKAWGGPALCWATGCCSSRCTAWACAWVKAWR